MYYVNYSYYYNVVLTLLNFTLLTISYYSLYDWMCVATL